MHVEAARHFIERRYAAIHGAVPATDYPHFCVVDSEPEMGPIAALGFRLAGEERLFLEDYLDDPIERVVSEKLGNRVNRDRIVEIGAHASAQSRATVALWARTARHLNGVADVAVAVLTGPLRLMFGKLGIDIHDLGAADPARLPEGASDWGGYYDLQPRICAGLIAPALSKLAGFDDGLPGMCA